jgi:hypothetical protein
MQRVQTMMRKRTFEGPSSRQMPTWTNFNHGVHEAAADTITVAVVVVVVAAIVSTAAAAAAASFTS